MDLKNIPSATEVTAKAAKKKREKDIEILAETFLKDSSERNFFNLVSRIDWGLRTYLYHIVHDNHAVDDIMSRTVEQIYFARDTFDNDIAKFSTWLYNIAYHNATKYLKDINIYGSRINCVKADISDMYESSLFENSDSEQECGDFGGYSESSDIDILFNGTNCVVYTKEKIFSDIYDASVDCMQYLPEKCRIVMKERYLDQKSVKDIAKNNNFSVYDVKNWLRMARRLLNSEIKNRYSDLYDMYTNSKIS